MVTSIAVWLRQNLPLRKWCIPQFQREAQYSLQFGSLQSKSLLSIKPTRRSNSSSSQAVRTWGHRWSFFHNQALHLQIRVLSVVSPSPCAFLPFTPCALSHLWTQKCSQCSVSGSLRPPVVIGRGADTHLPPAFQRFLYVPSLSKFIWLQLILPGRRSFIY